MKLLYIYVIKLEKMKNSRPFVVKYKVIKTEKQYHEYFEILSTLAPQYSPDEIELLQLLIDKWESDKHKIEQKDPVQLLKSLLKRNNLKAKDLIPILNLSKGTISKILNYQKGISKSSIRKLSNHFKISQSAFNRTYNLY